MGIVQTILAFLIQGRLMEVMSLLDDLAYSDKSTPGTRENLAEWNKSIQTARGWYRKA